MALWQQSHLSGYKEVHVALGTDGQSPASSMLLHLQTAEYHCKLPTNESLFMILNGMFISCFIKNRKPYYPKSWVQGNEFLKFGKNLKSNISFKTIICKAFVCQNMSNKPHDFIHVIIQNNLKNPCKKYITPSYFQWDDSMSELWVKMSFTHGCKWHLNPNLA